MREKNATCDSVFGLAITQSDFKAELMWCETFRGDITEPAHLLRLLQSPEMSQKFMSSSQMSDTFLILKQIKAEGEGQHEGIYLDI